MNANLSPAWLAGFEAVCTFAASASAVFVALRDARWRRSGLAKQLEDRITAAQQAADRWHETEPAVALKTELDRHGGILIDHAGALRRVATREDIERVEGKVMVIEETVRNAAGGIDRIEGILIKRALNPGTDR